MRAAGDTGTSDGVQWRSSGWRDWRAALIAMHELETDEAAW